MKRIIALLVAVSIVGCHSVTQTTSLENPQQVVEIKQGKEIEIITFDDRRLVMTYESATEEAITGYVTEIYDLEKAGALTWADDRRLTLDSIPFENIVEIAFREKVYKHDSIKRQKPNDFQIFLICLATFAVICDK